MPIILIFILYMYIGLVLTAPTIFHNIYSYPTEMSALLKTTTILILLSFSLQTPPQHFLPKKGIPPVQDIFTTDIARLGKTQFYKVRTDGWQYVLSALPFRPNSVTKVTFLLLSGDHFGIGCASVDLQTGFKINELGFNTKGLKYVNGKAAPPYGSKANQGDTIEMTVDLRPEEYSLSYAKNGLDMGVAFGGLNYLGEEEVYMIIWLNKVGHRIRIVDYEVKQNQ